MTDSFYYNIQTIRNILKKPIAENSEEILITNISLLQQEISKYLIEFSLFWLRLNQIKTQTQQIYSMIDASEEESLNYSIFKQLNVYESGINQLLIDGYEIVHRLREWITGQQIVYSIGTIYYGTLYEGKFSLEQILSKAKVGYSSNGILSLRLQMSKSNVVQKAAILEKDLEYTIDQGSSVFSRIFRYFYPSKAGKKPNLGNVYQVYRSIIAERKWPNPNKVPPPITSYIDEAAFLQYRMRIIKANTIPGTKGGDTVHYQAGSIIEEQDKFISSNPSLISILQIRNVLSTFHESLLKLQSGEGNFYEEMSSLFTKADDKNKISENLELIALKQVSQQLYENIEKIKNAIGH